MATKTQTRNIKKGALSPRQTAKPAGRKAAPAGTGSKAKPVVGKGAPKSKSTAPVSGPGKRAASASEIAAKKKASSRIETARPAPAVPQAANAARAEHRIPAAREKHAVAVPIKLATPPRSGVVRPRTHYAETPVAPSARPKR